MLNHHLTYATSTPQLRPAFEHLSLHRSIDGSLIAAEECRCLGVLVGAAADEVEDDEADGGNDERDVGLVPLVAKRLQEAGLAGLALVAELGRVVAPQPAVRVRRRPRRSRPHRRAHVVEPAHRRRLAATRLHTHICRCRVIRWCQIMVVYSDVQSG